jgi:putative holliday junction resolvase
VRVGSRLGIDVGTVRVGVARSDPHGLLAVPVATLVRLDAASDILSLVEEFDVVEVIVGLPLSLSGAHTHSTDNAEAFAMELAVSLPVPVRMIDERLSTVEAQAGLRDAGRSERAQRGVIDQAAAVILLQHALDSERSQGVAPGRLMEVIG